MAGRIKKIEITAWVNGDKGHKVIMVNENDDVNKVKGKLLVNFNVLQETLILFPLITFIKKNFSMQLR
jgi:hypothetical protein